MPLPQNTAPPAAVRSRWRFQTPGSGNRTAVGRRHGGCRGRAHNPNALARHRPDRIGLAPVRTRLPPTTLRAVTTSASFPAGVHAAEQEPCDSAKTPFLRQSLVGRAIQHTEFFRKPSFPGSGPCLVAASAAARLSAIHPCCRNRLGRIHPCPPAGFGGDCSAFFARITTSALRANSCSRRASQSDLFQISK